MVMRLSRAGQPQGAATTSTRAQKKSLFKIAIHYTTCIHRSAKLLSALSASTLIFRSPASSPRALEPGGEVVGSAPPKPGLPYPITTNPTFLPASAMTFAPRSSPTIVLSSRVEPWLTHTLKRINRVKRPMRDIRMSKWSFSSEQYDFEPGNEKSSRAIGAVV